MKSSAPRRRLESSTPSRSSASRGKRVAAKKTRYSLSARLAPILVGAASLAFAGVGAVAVGEAGNAPSADATQSLAATYSQNLLFDNTTAPDVSRSATREVSAELRAQQQAQQQEQIDLIAQQLADTEQQVEAWNEQVANQWVLPVTGYNVTARFGQTSGLWSSGTHTGVDFAGPSGSTIVSVASGVVKSAGYEGAYGNRTVVVLEDGTEVWYAHQSRVTVTVGQSVAPGEVIGYTGSTGNVTGPHLHLEVRPLGGDPIDPAAALADHGVTI